jgi:hypothetical protein
VVTELTPEQREVVDRIKASVRAGRSSLRAAHARAPVGIGEQAARYAHEHGVKIAAAAAHFQVSDSSVYRWYRKLYPNEPHRLGRRRSEP